MKLCFSVFLTILAILSIVFTLNINIRPDVGFLLLYLEGLVLGIALFMMVITVRSMLYVKNIKIKEVSSTKLEIQTSAFKDL